MHIQNLGFDRSGDLYSLMFEIHRQVSRLSVWHTSKLFEQSYKALILNKKFLFQIFLQFDSKESLNSYPVLRNRLSIRGRHSLNLQFNARLF